jgi:hypothetical protein
MTQNLELDEAPVQPMPASYVEFVRQLWREQEKESRHTLLRKDVLARRPVFLNLLASATLATELRRVYETPIGPKIAVALTDQAVCVPGLWLSEDKRTKEEKVAQFDKLRTVIREVSALLDQDRSMPDEEDTTRLSSSKVDAIAHRPVPAAFENIYSRPFSVRHWNGWKGLQLPDLKGTRLRLSLYQLHAILRAFDQPLAEALENINEFRTHAIDDPVLMHIGQIGKGIPKIRYAALLLDQSIDRFAAAFTQYKRKLSRDKLVSAFVMAIYPNTIEEVANFKAINRICHSRRQLEINTEVNPRLKAVPPETGSEKKRANETQD